MTAAWDMKDVEVQKVCTDMSALRQADVFESLTLPKVMAPDVVLCGRGTVWYRLVGVNLAQSNFTADAVTVIDALSQYTTLNVKVPPFVQVVTANSSSASGACPLTS